MTPNISPQIEDRIARCRLVLSVVAIAAVFADPTSPFVAEWIPLVSGRFTIDPYVLVVLGTHLLYSAIVYRATSRGWFPPKLLANGTVCADVGLGALIALMTEGATSPFYPFFAFAVVVAGFRAGLRQAMVVTTASVGLYLGMIAISAAGNWSVYLMRPAYLAIVGYLVGYLGQQRLDLQEENRQLEATQQRHRIARDLHDGFAQALAGITLRIEACRRSLRSNEAEKALLDLTDLQSSVALEYDALRTYMSGLADVKPSAVETSNAAVARVTLCVNVEGSIDLIDHLLQISREAVSNVRRHSQAKTASIRISTEKDSVRIDMVDDGVGWQGEGAPWSIASRVRELGGRIQQSAVATPGAQLHILLPQA